MSVFDPLRRVVSGSRRRFVDDEFDLDLSYITDDRRIIAMGLPSFGIEGLARNHETQVSAFFEKYHADRYLIVNLSERSYDYSKFGGRVEEFGFQDHRAPPLDVLWACMTTMAKWLKQDPKHVVAVHCKAGKGRTGIVISCWMIFSGVIYNRRSSAAQLAELAMREFLARRGQGVKYPSQQRTVVYFASLCLRWLYANSAPELRIPDPDKPGPPTSTAGSATYEDTEAAGAGGDVSTTTDGGDDRGGTVDKPSAGSSTAAAPPGGYSAVLFFDEDEVDLDESETYDEARSRVPATALTAMLDVSLSPELASLFFKLQAVKRAPLPPEQSIKAEKTAVLYNSSWDDPTPQTYKADDRLILFRPRNCVVSGDVTFEFTALPVESLMFYFSFHTSFVSKNEIDGGVFRLSSNDLDRETDSMPIYYPDGFHVDVIFTVGAAMDRKRKSVTETSDGWQGIGGTAGGSGTGEVEPHRPPFDAVASEMIDNKLVKMGYLNKVGQVVRSWKRRWFVLRHQMLSYYERESDATPKGVIPIAECGRVDLADLREAGRVRCLRLHHKDRVHYFQAKDNADLEQWMSALALALNVARLSRLQRPAMRRSSEPPPASSGTVDTDSVRTADVRMRVMQFYKTHNPSKANDEFVDKVLAVYEHKGAHQLFLDLRAKYAKAV